MEPRASKALWGLVGGATLIVVSAVAWRIVQGADFKAQGREVSIRLAEGANQLNEGTRLLREESERLREEALELDQKWKEAFATAQLACPRITWSRTLEKPPQVEAQRLDEIARRAVQAQVAAEKIEKSLETISWR